MKHCYIDCRKKKHWNSIASKFYCFKTRFCFSIKISLNYFRFFLLYWVNSPPPGIHLKPIENHGDLEKLNSVWSYRCRNSLTYFERMAKYNPNIGAFTDDGTLVSWMFRYSLPNSNEMSKRFSKSTSFICATSKDSQPV